MWISGLAALARNDFAVAETSFNTVLGQVPGELAPKLALALESATTVSYVGTSSAGAASPGAAKGDDFSDFPGALEDEDDDLPF